MARARPLNECVSRYTRALTLFHLPSATAFTIRAWSRRTVRQTFLHSMECQSGVRSGAAPASISAADISACLPESVGQGSLVTEHLREVGPLSRRGGCRPWEDSPSIRSTADRRWLPPSSLARRPIGYALRRTYPGGKTTGLPRSTDESRMV